MPTASCSSHHGHLTFSRHVSVGVWIEVRISDRVWMEGLHHMSGELFLLIEPNATLLSLKQHGIVDSCLFDGPQHPFDMFFSQNFLTTNCFLVFICAVDYFSLNVAENYPKNCLPWCRLPSIHCCSFRLAMQVKCIFPCFCTPVSGFTFIPWTSDVSILHSKVWEDEIYFVTCWR